MRQKGMAAVLMLGSLFASGALAAAGDMKPGSNPTTMSAAPKSESDRAMHHGMMQGGGAADGTGMMGGRGMMGGGMMGMMSGCGQMMSGNTPMRQLPPGNERLQLKMQGEMMQRMGEILTKYADQIKEGETARP